MSCLHTRHKETQCSLFSTRPSARTSEMSERVNRNGFYSPNGRMATLTIKTYSPCLNRQRQLLCNTYATLGCWQTCRRLFILGTQFGTANKMCVDADSVKIGVRLSSKTSSSAEQSSYKCQCKQGIKVHGVIFLHSGK